MHTLRIERDQNKVVLKADTVDELLNFLEETKDLSVEWTELTPPVNGVFTITLQVSADTSVIMKRYFQHISGIKKTLIKEETIDKPVKEKIIDKPVRDKVKDKVKDSIPEQGVTFASKYAKEINSICSFISRDLAYKRVSTDDIKYNLLKKFIRKTFTGKDDVGYKIDSPEELGYIKDASYGSDTRSMGKPSIDFRGNTVTFLYSTGNSNRYARYTVRIFNKNMFKEVYNPNGPDKLSGKYNGAIILLSDVIKYFTKVKGRVNRRLGLFNTFLDLFKETFSELECTILLDPKQTMVNHRLELSSYFKSSRIGEYNFSDEGKTAFLTLGRGDKRSKEETSILSRKAGVRLSSRPKVVLLIQQK